MTEFNNVKTDVMRLVDELTSFETKQTKAASARIRKLLGSIKNRVPTVRRELMDADKAGY